MLTEEVKTFIEILYLIIGYGPLRIIREFPSLPKEENVWTGQPYNEAA